MIIIEKPYVSDFLLESVRNLQIPVLRTEFTEELNKKVELPLFDGDELVEKVRNGEINLTYSNSENSINWVTNNLGFTDIPKKIAQCKDKASFRDLIKPLYPNFFYKRAHIDELDKIDTNELKFPFIIKPAVGFFSMGVYKVNNNEEWAQTIKDLREEVEKVKGLYPVEVMNSANFLIEEIIDGEEFALDAYFNKDGKPVILNIYKHLFSSDKDVSDRAYLTSKRIINAYYDRFHKVLSDIGRLSGLKNFPMHIEFRINFLEEIIPIEANPMRFAGWCMTDMAYYAYGVNPYECFFKQIEPDWDEILKDKDGKVYNVIIADIHKDINFKDVESVDYDKFTADFKKPLNLRKIDFTKYPVFAFMFSESEEADQSEFFKFLKSDLKEYIKVRS